MSFRANFSVILYGVGSKRSLLANFAEQYLTEGGLVEINAWRGKLSAKQIVITVLSCLYGIDTVNFRQAPYLHCIVAFACMSPT